jgi:Ni/Co efflux regulator RcnB
VIAAYSLRTKGSEREISSQEEDHMHSSYRHFLSAFFLTAALAAPTAINAATRPQDNGRQEENHRDDKDRNRVYDRDHKDYHNWNDNEDRSYRLYLGERHREYRPFAEVKQKEQRAYWNWRHEHPDHDHNGR